MMVKELTANEQKEVLRDFIKKLYENNYITKTEFDDLKTKEFWLTDDTDPNCYEFRTASNIERPIVVEISPYIDDADYDADGLRTTVNYCGAYAMIRDKDKRFIVYWEFGEDKLKEDHNTDISLFI
jgi:hypothetical protein